MKKLSELSDREYIHCRTQEQLNTLVLKSPKPLTYGFENYWVIYKEDTIVSIGRNAFATSRYAREKNYKIYKFEEIIMEEKMPTFKAGYIIENEAGYLGLILQSSDGELMVYRLVSKQIVTLGSISSVAYAANKVYEGITSDIGRDSMSLLLTGSLTGKLIWEKKRKVKVTLAQIAAKFGTSVDDLEIEGFE